MWDGDPSEEEIERFYINEVLPHTKQSITEILETPLYEELIQWDKDDLVQCILNVIEQLNKAVKNVQ
jgi:phage baseplate assembly protein W